MSSFSRALAVLHSEQKHTHVSRYVAEQLALQNSRSPDSIHENLNIPLETENTYSHQARHQSSSVKDIQKRNSEQYDVLVPIKTSAEPTYQKRARYKMRQDPIQPSKKPGKPVKATTKGKSSWPKAGKTKKARPLIGTSVIDDTTKKTRLTLKPHHNFGLFKNGRASAQVAIEKRGLPDLTFCEMAFLQSNNKKVEAHSGKPSECSGTPQASQIPLNFQSTQDPEAKVGPQLMSRTSIPHLEDDDDEYAPSVTRMHIMENQDDRECYLRAIDSDVGKHSPQIPNETFSNVPASLIQEDIEKKKQAISESHGNQNDESQRQTISHNDHPLPGTEGILETTLDDSDNTQFQTHNIVQTASKPTEADENHQPGGGGEDMIGKGLGLEEIISPITEIRSSSPLSTLLRACDDLISNDGSILSIPFCGGASTSSHFVENGDYLAMHPTPTHAPTFPSFKMSSSIQESQNGVLVEVPHIFLDERGGIVEGVSSLDQFILGEGDLNYFHPSNHVPYYYRFEGLDGELPMEKEIQDDAEFDAEEAYILGINSERDDQMYSANAEAQFNKNDIRITTGLEGDDTVYTIAAENSGTREYGVEDFSSTLGVRDVPSCYNSSRNTSSLFGNVGYFEPMKSEEGLYPVPVHEMAASFNWRPYWRS